MRGFVNILKPEGMTSSDVVVKVRGILSHLAGERQKVGHLGTLDPLATGVLPIGVGSCTRLFDVMLQKQKIYEAIFTFGKTTDTLDSAGKVVFESPFSGVDSPDVDLVLSQFTGKISQLPPQYSAKSVGGKRAYDIAREGGHADLKPAEVMVYSIKRLQSLTSCTSGEVIFPDESSIALEIVCGSGTYIRALARDIAIALGTVGYMSYLQRTKCGNFTLENAVALDSFRDDPLNYMLKIDDILNMYPIVEITPVQAKKLLNGVKIEYDSKDISRPSSCETELESDFALIKYGADIVALGKLSDGVLSVKIRL